MNVQPVTGVEEVNMFKEDGNVLHFGAPRGESMRSKLAGITGLVGISGPVKDNKRMKDQRTNWFFP